MSKTFTRKKYFKAFTILEIRIENLDISFMSYYKRKVGIDKSIPSTSIDFEL